jgi:asparagine synthase (glutamine-hydrolysing)
MCGLAVVYYKNKTGNYHLNKMLDTMSHRGHDFRTIRYYDNCSVGYNRLAITDRENNIHGSDHQWRIFLNGEIYNYKELGFEGVENSVLAQGLEKYGVDFVKQLNGMFVIVAISPEDQVYVFRDRYGIKPAYYYEDNNMIIVSSEIKPILQHPAYKFSINESAKKQWLTFNNVFTNETLFDRICKMDKGTIWNLNTNQTTKYWAWDFKPTPMDFETAKNEVKRLVIQAINRMIPKEVPYASCLSGGIDSNIIASQLPKEIETFCVGYIGPFIEDETELAMASGRNPNLVLLSWIENFEETIYHLEDLRVGACWSNYRLFSDVSCRHKVVFDGAGADELFGGYPWRYSEPNYYDVVNRTKNDSEFCKTLFSLIYGYDTLENRFKFDAEHFLEGVLLVTDRMSMAHTLEVRVPFLDNDLVDFCLTLPNEFKIEKRILKAAFIDELHPDILMGKKKGFGSPDWFPGEGNQANKWANEAYNQWKLIFNNYGTL